MDLREYIEKIAIAIIKTAIYVIVITYVFSIPMIYSLLYSLNIEPQSFMTYLIMIAILSTLTGFLENNVLGTIISIAIDIAFIAYLIMITSAGTYRMIYQGFTIEAKYPVLLFIMILPLLTSIIGNVWKIIHKSSFKPIKTYEKI